jgi:signal transduction histidine kinase/CheY-like chemotaxis protein
MSVLEIARYFPSIFEPIEVSFYTQVIFRSTALLGVVFLIFFVSRPYVASNDSNPELKRMNAELERANNFKRHFVTQVSHEARQPQNAVFAEAQYLKKLIKINPQLSIIAKHVDTLLQANTDSLEIINNILSMSEIEQGNVKSNPNTVFSLRDLIESNIKTNRRVGMLRQVRMKLSKIENIPEAIKGDRLMLKQILNNLFGNAIKYSYPNTTIGVSVKAEGRKFQIQVRNSGPTIEKENFEKIFDPYMMEGKVSTGNLASNGLGLFLVKNWVKIMEGNIFVESENEITTFSIDLPLIAGNVDEIVIENAVKAEYDLSRIHVYIAEDNHMSAASMVNHLTFEGCEVKSFLDGELLIKDLENGIPDIIILDWQMPVRDGKSTLRYLKNDERFSNIPVVVATADVFTESIQAIMDAGANAYLIKPINFELLFETVRQQLQSVDSELQE